MKELNIYVSDETQASEQQGYDVDVFNDCEDGRSDLSKVGLTKEDAEKYLDELKQEYNVINVTWQ